MTSGNDSSGTGAPGSVSDSGQRPSTVDKLCADPAHGLRIRIATAMIQAGVGDESDDLFEWHPCCDRQACAVVAKPSAPCPCAGRPYLSQAAWGAIASVMEREFATGPPRSGPPQVKLDEARARADVLAVARTGRHLDLLARWVSRWETQPAPVPEPVTPCPEGFHWIGQSFATCDQCGLPAWEHEGLAGYDSDAALPFFPPSFVLKPWAPGERERIRARWYRPDSGYGR